ncbi:MAG: phosphoribosylformylglycinamidine synthase subunit PurS [Rickettsiales bacterium]|nr:phosphoribosylformylglycinamidine synthase subunit PurS [Rickettsiales bacterium]
MKARIHITLKNGVLDPQGKATQNALHHLGFDEVSAVRLGKYIEVDLNESDRAAAEVKLKAMCEKLLANTVVENYRLEVEA